MADSSLAAVIAASARPATRSSLVHDLRALGLVSGMTVLVHSSLSQIGWVAGGPVAVIEALMEVLGDRGTLVMPTFTGDGTDPADWNDSPMPPDWIEPIRAALPVFDPARTPTRMMGQIPELFRTWPEVRRSDHPEASVAAWGRHADAVTAAHPLDWPLGDASPLGRVFDLDGQVLLLGVGHRRNSSLHLAEGRARTRRTETRRVPIMQAGARRWVSYQDVVDDDGRLFPAVGADFEASGAVRIGKIGRADSRLMAQRALVGFATAWFERHLAPAIARSGAS